MVRNYANNVPATDLNGAVTDSATSWTVTDGTGYPAVPFAAKCESEIVKVTAKSGTNDVNWTVERGFDGSTAAAHSDATEVTDAVIAADFDELWAGRAFSGAEVRKTSTQSIANTTWDAIEWDAVEYDTDSYWSSGNNTRITFPAAGKYLVVANPIFASSGTGARFARIVRNGTQTNELALTNISSNSTSGADDRWQVDAIIDAAANDYIEVEVYQDSTAALNIVGASGDDAETTRLWVYRIHSAGAVKLDDLTDGAPIAALPEHITNLGYRASAHTDDDEFDDGTITGWTAVSGGGTINWKESSGLLSALFEDQASEDICTQVKSMTPSSAPVTIETKLRLLTYSSTNPMCGLVFANGALATSSAISIMYYTVSGGHRRLDLRSGTPQAMSTLVKAYLSADIGPGDLYLRMIWAATNSWKVQWSPNGVHWTDWNAGAQSSTLAPTHYGVMASSWSAAEECIADFEYFRVTESDLYE